MRLAEDFSCPAAGTLTLVLLLCLSPAALLAQQVGHGSIVGVVRDQAGAIVTSADVALVHPQQALLRTTVTDTSGYFSFEDVPARTYEVRITKTGFGDQRVPGRVITGKRTELEIILKLAPISSRVTVTADTGQAQDKDLVPQALNIITEGAIQQ